MCLRRSGPVFLVVSFLLAASSLIAQTQPAAPSKYALLIGIDTYEPPGASVTKPSDAPAEGRFAGGLTFLNLKGPTHDVDAMRALLTSEKFAFPNDDEHIHILRDSEATHDAVLAAMKKYLVGLPKRGDTVVFYVSSHGSLRVNSKGEGQAYDVDGTGQHPTPLDNTIVTADAYLGKDDIVNREIRRIFNQAADKGIHLTAIIDACHSGGQARGVGDPHMVPRMVEFDPRDLRMPPDTNPNGSPIVAPEDRQDNPVLVFSASQKDQSAIDVQDANPPHGLFTDALVEALQALPADASANDVYRRVLVNVELSPGASNQQPALDGTATRRQQPLFGGEALKTSLHAAIVSIRDDGSVVLDIGPVADVGKGSEFTDLTTTNGAKPVLRVIGDDGIARSIATVVSPPRATVHSRDIVDLRKWVPAPNPVISFYAGPTNLTISDVRAAVTALRQAQIMFVGDPSSEPWSHLITWNGSEWLLQEHDEMLTPGTHSQLRSSARSPAEALGPTLDGAALVRKLPATSVVWLDAPLPRELTQGLLASKDSTAQMTSDRRQATYVAVGVPTATGLSYAWYDRGGFDAQQRTPPGFGRGCSANSPYPLRTDWVTVEDGIPLSVDRLTGDLNMSAARLAKLNGWLQLQSSVTGSSNFPYNLGLQRVSDQRFTSDGGNTYKDERYMLTLNGSIDTIVEHPRWVYVLGIDCQGAGQLLWPREGPGGRFPTDSGRLASIPLPGLTFRITPPFGTDTYILLTTSSPLPEPDVLNFEGVVRGGSRGAPNPLENLLLNTSAGTRGTQSETPTDWSVEMLQTHSQPVALSTAP